MEVYQRNSLSKAFLRIVHIAGGVDKKEEKKTSTRNNSMEEKIVKA